MGVSVGGPIAWVSAGDDLRPYGPRIDRRRFPREIVGLPGEPLGQRLGRGRRRWPAERWRPPARVATQAEEFLVLSKESCSSDPPDLHVCPTARHSTRGIRGGRVAGYGKGSAAESAASLRRSPAFFRPEWRHMSQQSTRQNKSLLSSVGFRVSEEHSCFFRAVPAWRSHEWRLGREAYNRPRDVDAELRSNVWSVFPHGRLLAPSPAVSQHCARALFHTSVVSAARPADNCGAVDPFNTATRRRHDAD